MNAHTHTHVSNLSYSHAGAQNHTHPTNAAVRGGHGWAVLISSPSLQAPQAEPPPPRRLGSGRGPRLSPAPPARRRGCHLALAASGYGVL